MFRHGLGLLSVLAWWCLLGAVARAQTETPAGFGFVKVVHGNVAWSKRAPDLVKADTNGGEVRFKVRHTRDCVEEYRFHWKFDRDVSWLKLGETFDLTVTPELRSPNCAPGQNLYMRPSGSYGSITSILSNLEKVGIPSDQFDLGVMRDSPIPGSGGRVYAKGGKSGSGTVIPSGTKTANLWVWDKANGAKPYAFFKVYIEGLSGLEKKEAFMYEVVYIYKLSKRPPEPVVGKPGGPMPPGRPGDTTQPGGGPGTGPGAAGGLPADPCTNSHVQRCIDEWLRLAVRILNRRHSNQGPWRISQYGQLENRSVRSAGPPDGWNTTYRRIKHCYVWATWTKMHQNDLYGGELPPLRSYVVQCVGSGAGTGGTGTAGTGTGGSGVAGGPSSPGGAGGTGGPGGGLPGGPTRPGGTGGRPDPASLRGMTLVAARRVVRQGDTVQLPVYLLRASDVANINFTMNYDPSVVAAETDPFRGNLVPENTLFASNAAESTIVRVGFAGTGPVSGDGTVAEVRFQAVGRPGDSTSLALTVTKINNPSGTELPIDVIHGRITIVDASGKLPGDCNGDGRISFRDALCPLLMSVRKIAEDLAMDMNRDGTADSADSVIILRIALGLSGN